MRNFTKTLAVLSLLAPATSYPLGIGDIQLHSSLNQKLDAEIPVTLDPGQNPSDFIVKLAPIEKFDQHDIPWDPVLWKVKISTQVKPSGGMVIKLTSNDAITEPMMDILIEVSSAGGVSYREFTVFIDPPEAYIQPPTPSTALPTASAKRYSQTPQPVTQVSRSAIPSTPRSVPAGIAMSGESIAVRNNDTLLGIAARSNPYPDVSREQLVMALYEANPQAFFRNNINALKAGANLQIPTKESLLRLDRSQALAAFNNQNQEWRTGVVSSPSQAAGTDTERLTLSAPSDADVTAQTQVDASAPGSSDGQSAALAAKAKENQQMQERLRMLEQKIDEMQKLIELKDEKLAALQSGIPPSTVSDTTSQTTPAVTPPVDSTPPTTSGTPPVEPIPPVASVTPPVEPVPPVTSVTPKTDAAPPATGVEPKTKAGSKPPVTASQTDGTTKPVTDQAGTGTPKTDTTKPATKKTPKKQTVKPQPAPVVKEEETPYLMYGLIGGAVLAVAGMVGWILLRKRRIEEEQSKESMFASSSQISLPSVDEDLLGLGSVGDSSGYSLGAAGSSSFLTDFGSEFTVFDTDQNEVDPVSEADVYLAYGRYQQAEELMLSAIQDQPDRDECKLKLLEIYYTNNNSAAFEGFAQQLVDAGKARDTAFWTRVVEMGAEMLPGSPLFSDTKLPGSEFLERPAPKTAGASTESAGEASFGEAVFDTGDADEPVAPTHADAADTHAAGDDMFAPGKSPETDTVESFDFDFTAFDSDETADTGTIATEDSFASGSESFGELQFPTSQPAAQQGESFETFAFTSDASALEGNLGTGDESFGELQIPTSQPAAQQEESFETFAFSTDASAPSDGLATGGESFGELQIPPSQASAQEESFDSFGFDLDFGTGSGDQTPVAAGSATDDLFDTFDFTGVGEEAAAIPEPKAETPAATEEAFESFGSFDFDDLAGLGAGAPEPEMPGAVGASVEQPDTDDSFKKFDFFTPPEDTTPKGSGFVDFDLENLGKDTITSHADDMDFTSSLSPDSGFVNLKDLDDEPTDAMKGFNFGGDFNLTDMDELETKIDLARAYIDMGDIQAAKEIAQEVLEKGNANQKSEAQALIESL